MSNKDTARWDVCDAKNGMVRFVWGSPKSTTGITLTSTRPLHQEKRPKKRPKRSRWRIAGDVFLLAAIVYLTVRLFVPFIVALFR